MNGVLPKSDVDQLPGSPTPATAEESPIYCPSVAAIGDRGDFGNTP